MLGMVRAVAVLVCYFLSSLWAYSQSQPSYPSFDYEIARKHEVKPFHSSIPLQGVQPGVNQIHLVLTVSADGEVLDAKANGDPDVMKFWPQVKSQVRQWMFTPFEVNGVPITAEVEEYVDLVPPERLPKKHMKPPVLRPTSDVIITLERSGCLGTCPSYKVTISTSDGIVFNGGGFVVASGRHVDKADPNSVRKLAKEFVTDDFYSMDPTYRALVTDCPTYTISVSIDGHKKEIEDYMGSRVGMPEVISDLENEVDSSAHTDRWIEGSEGLVQALRAEKCDFHSLEAQAILREAANRGQTTTVRELLKAGVSLKPLPAPKTKAVDMARSWVPDGWLTAAGSHPDTLQALMDADASEYDQNDKNLALVAAARSGNIEAAQELISYGANPNANLSKSAVRESGGGMTIAGAGAGSILIYAAESGNPDMVHLILRYQPNLEARDREGKTAIFAAGDYRSSDKPGARVECVRLLIQAGANVNARDNDGNTPLHETFLTDVEKEMLKSGANVNARNNDGETPIFTTVDNGAIPLFVKYGANLNIRNNKGQDVIEAAKADGQGPQRVRVLQVAIQKLRQRQIHRLSVQQDQ